MWKFTREVRHGNIYDPVRDTLDQHVFSGQDPRLSVQKFILGVYYRALDKQLGVVGTQWADLYLTGSLTTYQYNETSDCDISVFPDYDLIWKHLDLDPDQARRELVEMSINRLDGIYLPGTQHPLQFFVQPNGILPSDTYQVGLRAGYDLQSKVWFVPPDKSLAHDVKVEQPQEFERAEAIASKMELMLDSQNYDAARTMWEDVHRKRQLDQRAGLGDRSEGNIVYKWLLHQGLFDRIRTELGEYIAKTSTLFDPLDRLRYDEFSAFGYSLTTGELELNNTHVSVLRELMSKFGENNVSEYGERWTDAITKLQPVLGWIYVDRQTGVWKIEFMSDLYFTESRANEEGAREAALNKIRETYPDKQVEEAQRSDYPEWSYRRADVNHLWEDRVTTKVIYDFDKDRIVLGTQATIPDLPNSKIVGEYSGGKVTLFEADKQWINPTYFRRLWHHSYPERELKDVYYRRDSGDEYKLKSLPRRKKGADENIPKFYDGDYVVMKAYGDSGVIKGEPRFQEGQWWYYVDTYDSLGPVGLMQFPEEDMERPSRYDQPGEMTIEDMFGIPESGEEYFRNASR